MKNRTFLVSRDVMSLDTNIQQNEGILKLSVTKHEYDIRAKTPTRMTMAITFSHQNMDFKIQRERRLESEFAFLQS